MTNKIYKNERREKYIPLSEAAKVYGCTQKHLNLMARRGKLKAVKVGRNWMTTLKWLKDYTEHLGKVAIQPVLDKYRFFPIFKKAFVALLLAIILISFIGTIYVSGKNRTLPISDSFKKDINTILSAYSSTFTLIKETTKESFDSLVLNYTDFAGNIFTKNQKINNASSRAILETNEILASIFNIPATEISKTVSNKLASIIDSVKELNSNINKKVFYIAKTIIKGFVRVNHLCNQFIARLLNGCGNFTINKTYRAFNLIIKFPSSVAHFANNAFSSMGRFFASLPQAFSRIFSFRFVFPFYSYGPSGDSFDSIKDLYHRLSDLRSYIEGKKILVREEIKQITQEITITQPVRKEVAVIKDKELLDAELATWKSSILTIMTNDLSALEGKIGNQMTVQNNYYFTEATKVGRIDAFNNEIDFNENTDFYKDINVLGDIVGVLNSPYDIIVSGSTQFAGGSIATTSYSRYGTNTTGHSLDDEADLLLSGDLEVDGSIYFDGAFTSDTLSATHASISDDLSVDGTASVSALTVAQQNSADGLVIRNAETFDPAYPPFQFTKSDGTYVGHSYIDANGNILIGYYAGGLSGIKNAWMDTTFIGEYAGYSMGSLGWANTGIGAQAFYDLVYGSQNLAIGDFAGSGAVYGNFLTLVGYMQVPPARASYITSIGENNNSQPKGRLYATPTSGTNLGIGDYWYTFSYVINSVETPVTYGYAKPTTTSGQQAVNLSSIDTYSGIPLTCTARKIYRTKVNDPSKFYLLATIADNTTTTYSDTTADASLGAELTTEDSIILVGHNLSAFFRKTAILGGDSGDRAITDLYLNDMWDSSPTGITLHAQGGQGTNIAGSDFTIAAGQGTGTGAGGSIIFQTAPAGTTGSSWNTLASAMTIDSNGNVGIGTSTPDYKLDIAGQITASSSYINGLFTGVHASISDDLSVDGTASMSALTITQQNSADGLVIKNAATYDSDYPSFVFKDSTGVWELGRLFFDYYENFYAGNVAGKNLVTGSYNIFIGTDAGKELIIGSDNIIEGWDAGYEMHNGSGNVFLGIDSGLNASSANLSTFIGPYSGNAGVYTYGDILIGYQGNFYLTPDPTLAIAAGAGLEVGDYRYAVSFVLNGVESTLSRTAIKVTTTMGNQQVNVTSIATYSGPMTCTARKVYRTKVNASGTWYLLTTIADNSTTTYLDSTADGALGAELNDLQNIIGIGYGIKSLGIRNTAVLGSLITDFYLNEYYSTTPVDVSLHSSGGSGTNVAGSDFTIAAGQGTGTGAGGSIIFQTAPAGTTGSSWNTLASGMTIDSNGNVGIGTSTPDYKLDVAGQITASSSYINGLFTGVHASISDDLTIGDNITFSDLTASISSATYLDNTLNLADDFTIGSGSYNHIIKNSDAEGLAGADLRIGLDESNRSLIIGDKGDIDTDFGLAAAASPVIRVYAADATWYTAITGGSGVSSNGSLTFTSAGGGNINMDVSLALAVTSNAGASFTQVTDRASDNLFSFKSNAGAELTDSDAKQSWLYVEPKVRQTGTAAFDAIYASVGYESLGDGSTGEGNNMLRFTYDNNNIFRIDTLGNLYASGSLETDNLFTGVHASISDDLTIGDNITFSDLTASISGALNLDSTLTLADDFTIGSGSYSHIIKNSDAEGLAGADLRIGLDESNRSLIIGDKGDIDTDFGLAAAGAPTLIIWNESGAGYVKLLNTELSAISTTGFHVHGSGTLNLQGSTATKNLSGAWVSIDSDSTYSLNDTDNAQQWLLVAPKVTQTGTAAFDAILASADYGSLGDGSTGEGNNMLRLVWNSGNIFRIDTSGNLYASGSIETDNLLSAVHASISDDLTIGDNITFSDITASISSATYLDSTLNLADDFTIGSGSYNQIIKNSDAEGLTGADLRIGLDESNRMLIVTDRTDINTDYTLSASSHPSIVIYSADNARYAQYLYSGITVNGSDPGYTISHNRYIKHSLNSDYGTAGGVNIFDSGSGIELTDSDAKQSWLYLEPKVRQTGTAAFDAIYASVGYESLGDGSTGEGNNMLRFTYDNNNIFRIDTLGNLYASGSFKSDSTATSSFAGGVSMARDLYVADDVSALTFTDRTPYPKDLATAYEAVLSMQRLPDGEYDESDPNKQLDHSKLSDFIKGENGGRSLSAAVSAENEVLKDLIGRVQDLEGFASSQAELTLNSNGAIDSSQGIAISDGFLTALFDKLKEFGVEISKSIVKIAQLAVKTLVVEKNTDQAQSSIGEGVIAKDSVSAEIKSNQIMATSKIFITFRGDYGSRWWINHQEKGLAIINIADPVGEDIKFDWWIVQTEPVEIIETSSPAANEISPDLPVEGEISPPEADEITASGSEQITPEGQVTIPEQESNFVNESEQISNEPEPEPEPIVEPTTEPSAAITE